MTVAVLAATSISVRIGAKTLLDDVSLSLEPGRSLPWSGRTARANPRCCGVLSGDLAPHAGSRPSERSRARTSYGPRALASHRAVLSQSLSVVFPFTVAEIVRMGAGDGRGRRIDDMVDAALAEVDLAQLPRSRRSRHCRAASSSARIWRGCWSSSRAAKRSMGPGVLLLDEPTANLDLRHQLDVMAAATAPRRRAASAWSRSCTISISRRCWPGASWCSIEGRIDCDGPPSKTITNEMLRRVFGVSGAVGAIPAGPTPFVLPHAAQTVRPPAQSTESI